MSFGLRPVSKSPHPPGYVPFPEPTRAVKYPEYDRSDRRDNGIMIGRERWKGLCGESGGLGPRVRAPYFSFAVSHHRRDGLIFSYLLLFKRFPCGRVFCPVFAAFPASIGI